ncbi:MAG: hypothetical protein J5738_01900 [Lachnospiraceae bacterium]|nr:hypothetical protein [Lachnospiraceae bacterium]
MTGKKKNSITLRRKQFLIALGAVCLIAIIAEAVLLIHTFSKKKDKKQTPVTPTQQGKLIDNVTPTPTPTVGLEPAFTTVWRLASEKTTYSSGSMSNYVSYEYDERGTEIKRIYYDSESGSPEKTILLHHDRSGIILAEYWVPDENGRLEEKRCYYPTCYGVSIDYMLTQNPYLFEGEIIESCHFDEEGNLTGELRGYHQFLSDPPMHSVVKISQDGQLISHEEYDADDRLTAEFQFTYDSEGRLSEIIKKEDGSSNPYVIYRYEDSTRNDSTTYIFLNSEGTNGNVYKGDVEVETFYDCGDEDAWERMTREDNPDRSIAVGYEHTYHLPNGRFPHGGETYKQILGAIDYIVYSKGMTARVLRKTELREDGQPLKEVHSADGIADVRLASELTEKTYEYDNNITLSRITDEGDVYSFAFDREGNLTQFRSETYGYQTDYEWIAVSYPLY